MKRNILILLVLITIILTFFAEKEGVWAFNLITAQEAFDMLNNGNVKLLDVRTLEEYTFVGNPALEPGGNPVAYLVSWMVFEGLDQNGNTKLKKNPDFDQLIEQVFGSNKNQPLIVMCACGIRSTYAAERLEQLGYTNVYEIDNKLKEISSYPGGYGGFQGSPYNDMYNGYKAYPDRLPAGYVKTVTSDIDNEDYSVSWMDTGLPITHKTDPQRIPKIVKKEASPSYNTLTPLFGINYSLTNFLSMSSYTPLSVFPGSSYGASLNSSFYQYGQYPFQSSYQGLLPQSQSLYPSLYMPNSLQLFPGQYPISLSCDKVAIGSG